MRFIKQYFKGFDFGAIRDWKNYLKWILVIFGYILIINGFESESILFILGILLFFIGCLTMKSKGLWVGIILLIGSILILWGSLDSNTLDIALLIGLLGVILITINIILRLLRFLMNFNFDKLADKYTGNDK